MVEGLRKQRLQKYDKFLKSFQYSACLDSVLEAPQNPVIVISVIQELVHRSGIKIALVNRDDKSLIPLLKFLLKYIIHPRYNPTLVPLLNMVLGTILPLSIDIYGHLLRHSFEACQLLDKIKLKVRQEVRVVRNFNNCLGMLDTVFAHAG